jgi:hypothetical protein
MRTENDKWASQIQSLIFTPTAILKLIGASLLWQLIGVALGFAFNIGITIIFIVICLGILWLFPYWQPAYSIIYQIVGNKSISPFLESHKLKWWQYLSPGLKLLFLASVLYIAVKLILR